LRQNPIITSNNNNNNNKDVSNPSSSEHNSDSSTPQQHQSNHNLDTATTATTTTTRRDGNGNGTSSDISVLNPILSLLGFTILCRMILALLIYHRHSNQSFELEFDEMGQIQRRRVINMNMNMNHQHQGRRSSFWSTIFRSIPIRQQQSRRQITHGNRRFSRHRHQLQQFSRLANRLNEQRLANGARPLNMQSLELLFSNRDFNPEDYDALLDVQEQNETRNSSFIHGASEEEINSNRCPTRILVSDDELVAVGDGNNDDDNDESNSSFVERTKCVICLEHYKENEYIRTLPCLHNFHTLCVDRWLTINSLCPICKCNICE
jgi:hypothetical protein